MGESNVALRKLDVAYNLESFMNVMPKWKICGLDDLSFCGARLLSVLK